MENEGAEDLRLLRDVFDVLAAVLFDRGNARRASRGLMPLLAWLFDGTFGIRMKGDLP
jgi:hypothetical protein